MNCHGIKGLDRFIQLSDLLLLDIQPENDKEDYSPVNSVIELRPSHAIAELKKEKRSRILDVAAFTDFVGMDQGQPNGLVQIEAKRKFNINTKSRLLRNFDSQKDIANQLDLTHMYNYAPKQLGRTWFLGRTRTLYMFSRRNIYGKATISSKLIHQRDTTVTYTPKGKQETTDPAKLYTIIIKNKKFKGAYFTPLSHLEPKLLFSKLDQNKRIIDSAGLAGNKIDPVKLIQYQLVSFGVDLNVMKFVFPEVKFSWNALGVGIYWSRTRVGTASDSTSASVPINSSLFKLSTEVQFKPDSRWGASLGVNYIKPRLWNNQYDLASTHPIIQPYFDAFLKTNSTDKLFFRFRWSYEHSQHTNNFTQMQLGYNMNLFTSGNTSR
jgi:hypothetical protein